MTLLTLEHLQRLRLRQRSLPVIEDGPMFHSARGAAGQRDQARESAAEVRPPHVAAPSERLAALSARLRAANDSAAPANERADAAPAPRTAVARLQTLFNKGPEAPADREDEAVEEARPVSVRAPRRAPDSKPKSAPLGPCARCGGTGVVEGAVATFCSCPVGKAKHDRELALSWAPEEAKLIGALLDARAEQAPHAPVRSALLAASQHIQGAGYNRDGAAKVLRKEAARAEASAVRSELLAAADAIEAGDHLPPAPERDVADARAMAAHMIARATKLSPQDAAVIRAEAETIARFALPRGMAGARLTRLARKVSRPLAAWLLDVASDIGIGAYDRAEAEPTASLGEPPVLAVEDAGPATRAHGNEAPASTLGSMSFDPAKLEATATTGGEASAEPANAEPAERNEVAPAAPAGDVVVEPPAPALPRGIRLWEDEGRVKVRFPARPEQNTPEAAVMEALKRAGFIWFKRGGAWTKRASEEARRQARAAIALAGEVEAGPVPTMVVLTREQAANRLVGVFKKHGLHSEVRTWARPWTVTAYYVDRVGPKKKPISQDLGSFYFAAAGGVGVAAVEAHLRDQRHLARALLESALAGVRVLSADEEAAGEKGTPDAPPPAPTSEVIEEITRDEAAARIAKALREAGLGPGVVVTIEQAKHRDGSAVLYVYARASAKRWRKLVEVSYGRFTLRRRGGVGLDAVRAEYGEREPQARIALERVLTGVRVLPMPGFEGPDGDEPPKGEPPAEPPAHAATVVSGPVVAGPPRDVYTLPDGGRLELGRALGAGLGAIAIHHPPAGGGRMESRDLVDGRVLAAPIVQRYAAAPEEDRLLFAALAARLGSTQAKADHEAALAVLPTPPPPLSKRSLQMGAWELEHDRNDQTITLRRAPRTGVIFTNEQDELGKLGLEIRTPTMARAPYSDALWAQLVAWLDQVATPSSAPEAPRLGRLTRHEAAEHVAQALRGHGYEARVIAPAGASGPVRVSATRDQIAGSIWLLLDGRLRIEPTRGAREAETAHELERIAAEALGGRAIEAAERAAAPVMVGPIELVQDEAGSWVARAPLEHDGETFPTRDEAERYARRIGAQRASRNVGSAPAANVPTTTGSDDGNTPVTFDFSGVRIARWHEGAPVVVLPFELRFEDGPRRGELHAWEEVDREARGHFRFVRGFINAEGERYGAHGYGANPPAWVRDVMTPLLTSYPVHAVDFDGARVEPTGGRMLVRFDAEPSEAVRRELRRGKFRRAADTT